MKAPAAGSVGSKVDAPGLGPIIAANDWLRAIIRCYLGCKSDDFVE